VNRLSAVIITLNEERNIGRCLRSLEGVADEMVVVDSGSTDSTADICREMGAHFHHNPWPGYGPQRTHATGLTVHGNIIVLDADEALSDELRQSLLQWKENGAPGAFRFNRLSNYCGHWVRHSGWYPDRKFRMFPKGKAHWTDDRVHERLLTDLPIGHMKGDLLHYTCYTVDEHRERATRYAKLAAEQRVEQGKRGSLLRGAVRAITRFIKIFFFKRGFLDGNAGWNIAVISAGAAYQREVFMKELKDG
jgi:glycosyltransferase involved in cell wall biosynthesis